MEFYEGTWAIKVTALLITALYAQLVAVTPAEWPLLPDCAPGATDCIVGFAFTDSAGTDLGYLVTTAHNAVPGWWYDPKHRYMHWHGRYWSKDWRVVAIVQRSGGIQEQMAILENVERKPKAPTLEAK